MKRANQKTKLPAAVADLRPSPSNPRRMSQEARAALSRSMREFGDLSSLVFNVRTGHLVAGHQRKGEIPAGTKIVRTEDRKDSVGTVAVGYVEAHGTSWPVRFVEWPELKEKAANLAANSPLLSGEFTEDVGLILKEIRPKLGELAESLRLGELAPLDEEAAGGTVESMDVLKPIGRVWVLIGLPADQYAKHSDALERIARGKDIFFDSTIR